MATTWEKEVVGRKRHVVVDTLGLLWALVITPASVHDCEGGNLALTAWRRVVKFPKVIWVDQAYRALVSWTSVLWLWCVEIATRPRGRFVLPPRRWVVERTFGWLGRSRRLGKLFERTTDSKVACATIGMIHLMVRRLR